MILFFTQWSTCIMSSLCRTSNIILPQLQFNFLQPFVCVYSYSFWALSILSNNNCLHSIHKLDTNFTDLFTSAILSPYNTVTYQLRDNNLAFPCCYIIPFLSINYYEHCYFMFTIGLILSIPISTSFWYI